MKKVNDYLDLDHFWIIRKSNGEPLGLQVNLWGETDLSDMYGDCEVIDMQVKTSFELWGPYTLYPDEKNNVLYI